MAKPLTERGGRVRGRRLFPWGTEEANINFQLAGRRARDIVRLI